MQGKDRWSSIFLLLVSLVVLQQAFEMGLGNINSPGPGLVPMILGAILAVLSTIVFLRDLIKPGKQIGLEDNRQGFIHARLGQTVVSMGIYAYVFPKTGFYVSTFLFLIVLFRDTKRKWWIAVLYPALTVLGTYILFTGLLGIRFPKGDWGLL